MTHRAEFERLLDVYGFRCERFGQDLSTHARAQVVSAFAALASAPVAGEAQPSDIDILGLAGQYIQPSPVDVALQIVNFSRALLSRYAAPQASEAVRGAALTPLLARALAEWHEDDGPVTWWAWCGHEWASEAPYCGTPLDQDWPGYHTHWTPIPGVPAALSAQPGAQKGGSDA